MELECLLGTRLILIPCYRTSHCRLRPFGQSSPHDPIYNLFRLPTADKKLLSTDTAKRHSVVTTLLPRDGGGVHAPHIKQRENLRPRGARVLVFVLPS